MNNRVYARMGEGGEEEIIRRPNMLDLVILIEDHIYLKKLIVKNPIQKSR